MPSGHIAISHCIDCDREVCLSRCDHKSAAVVTSQCSIRVHLKPVCSKTCRNVLDVLPSAPVSWYLLGGHDSIHFPSKWLPDM